MTRWLEPQEVADRLGVARRTAMSLMMEMNPVPITGKVRMRYRVSEDSLELWMQKRTIGKPLANSISKGSKKKLQRR